MAGSVLSSTPASSTIGLRTRPRARLAYIALRAHVEVYRRVNRGYLCPSLRSRSRRSKEASYRASSVKSPMWRSSRMKSAHVASTFHIASSTRTGKRTVSPVFISRLWARLTSYSTQPLSMVGLDKTNKTKSLFKKLLLSG